MDNNKEKGPTAVTAEPQNKEVCKPKRTTRKGKSKKTCIMFPDCPPRKGKDRTGERYAYLTFLYPVCRCFYENRPNASIFQWLAQCDCTREVITIFGRSSSCGFCNRPLYKPSLNERIKPVDPSQISAWRPKKGFDRLAVCTRKNGKLREICKHYSECQDERVFDGKKVSTKYTADGGCYEPVANKTYLKSYARILNI